MLLCWTNFEFQNASFHFYASHLQSYANFISSCQELGDISLEDRLKQRDKVHAHSCHFILFFLQRSYAVQILVSAQQSADRGSLLSLILRQLEAIKFATDWKIIGQQHGGKKYKGTFTCSVYEICTG